MAATSGQDAASVEPFPRACRKSLGTLLFREISPSLLRASYLSHHGDVPQWIRGPPRKEISSLGLSLSLTLLHVIGHVEQGRKRHRSIQSCTPQWSHFAAVGGPSSAIVPRHSSATSVPCRDFRDCLLVVPDQLLRVQFPSQAPRVLPQSQAPGYLRLPAVRGRRSAVVAGQQRSSLLLPCAPAPTRHSTTPAPGRRRSSRGGRRPRRHMFGGPRRHTRSHTRSRIRSCSHIRTRTRRAAARVGSG